MQAGGHACTESACPQKTGVEAPCPRACSQRAPLQRAPATAPAGPRVPQRPRCIAVPLGGRLACCAAGSWLQPRLPACQVALPPGCTCAALACVPRACQSPAMTSHAAICPAISCQGLLGPARTQRSRKAVPAPLDTCTAPLRRSMRSTAWFAPAPLPNTPGRRCPAGTRASTGAARPTGTATAASRQTSMSMLMTAPGERCCAAEERCMHAARGA